jgi:glycosyltransferase involved in cell wall biosynthesis
MNGHDIGKAISQRQVVVLPFTSGVGIKNKLLEASALGKAIVCTPWTVNELAAGKAVVEAKSPKEWVNALVSLWKDAEHCKQLGQAARAWVLNEHTWQAVAENAIRGIEASMATRSAT